MNKKTIFIISLMASAPNMASASDCPLHRRQAALSAKPAVIQQAASPIVISQTPPILGTSSSTGSPESSESQSLLATGNLSASPPFEASDMTVDMTAGAATMIAPSQTVAASAPPIVQMAEAPGEPESIPINDWDRILGTYLKAPGSDGLARFDYAGLKSNAADRDALSAYIKELEAKNPLAMTDAEAVAYWANLYNAVTVDVVTDNYPVKSIKQIKSGVFSSGPWKKDLVTVNGNAMSLDDIEHKTMRKKYPSPLIHYMVNCASIGCPNLKPGSWKAGTLESDRLAAARAFINSPRGAVITDKGLKVSSIYDWFEEDFGGNKAGVLAHISEYAEGDLKAAIDGGTTIADYDYNWSLNE